MDPKIHFPFWCFIFVNQKEKDIYLEVLESMPIYRDSLIITNEKLLEKLKNFFEITIQRTNTFILMQILKETLVCPSNLLFPRIKDPEAKQEVSKPEEPKSELPKRTHKPDTRRQGFGRPQPPKTKENPSVTPQALKYYDVPLVYRRYFIINFNFEKGKVLKSLLKYFFSNFVVLNLFQTYVGLYEKEVYILTFDTKEFKVIESDENAEKFEPLSDEIVKNKKHCVELNIYSINEINIDALNYFTKHIVSAKTNEEIKLICLSLVRNDKVRLSKEISDYLLDQKIRKSLIFQIPDYIDNLPVFLIYLRQNLLKKIFSHNTVSQETSLLLSTSAKNLDGIEDPIVSGKSSMVKKSKITSSHHDVGLVNINKQNEEENGSISLKNSMMMRKSVEVMVEKSDYCFLFNFLREVNGSAILLEQIFGWGVFLMLFSIR